MLMWLDDEMESPEDFNERIKQEEHGGLIAEQYRPSRKNLTDKEG